MDRLDYIAKQQGRLTVTGAPQGYDAYVMAEAAKRRGAHLSCSWRRMISRRT